MRGFVAPTDYGWYQFLRARPHLREVNFWRPGAGRFNALSPGEPFFFKLKSPHNAIGGFGLFARFAELPVWRVWEVFGEENGVSGELELRERLARLAKNPWVREDNDRLIGCVSISEPVLFSPDEWVTVPADWSSTIVRGRGYDLTSGDGRRLWAACLERAELQAAGHDWIVEAADRERHGKPQVVLPRLGQGSFRIAVLDAYGNACAVTTEHSLPVLEAAHIKPYGDGGEHQVRNGLPLRRDLHRLFDLGFMTVRRDHRLAVSEQLRHAWHNGRAYYELEGREIVVPDQGDQRPDPALLEWHGDVVFRR